MVFSAKKKNHDVGIMVLVDNLGVDGILHGLFFVRMILAQGFDLFQIKPESFGDGLIVQNI